MKISSDLDNRIGVSEYLLMNSIAGRNFEICRMQMNLYKIDNLEMPFARRHGPCVVWMPTTSGSAPHRPDHSHHYPAGKFAQDVITPF